MQAMDDSGKHVTLDSRMSGRMQTNTAVQHQKADMSEGLRARHHEDLQVQCDTHKTHVSETQLDQCDLQEIGRGEEDTNMQEVEPPKNGVQFHNRQGMFPRALTTGKRFERPLSAGKDDMANSAFWFKPDPPAPVSDHFQKHKKTPSELNGSKCAVLCLVVGANR
jgi:hypothetical protein